MLTLFIFIVMDGAVTIAGPLTPLAYLLAALLVLANVLGYIELAVTVPRPGGAYTLVHEVQDGWLAFLTGWTLTLSGLGVCALLAQGFAVQVTTLLNDYLELALPVWPWAVGLVILLAINNLLGTRGSWRRRIAILLMTVLLGFVLLSTPRIKIGRSQLTSRVRCVGGQPMSLALCYWRRCWLLRSEGPSSP
jgi:amino acid transporter